MYPLNLYSQVFLYKERHGVMTFIKQYLRMDTFVGDPLQVAQDTGDMCFHFAHASSNLLSHMVWRIISTDHQTITVID